jgi:cobalt-zinc-cadmium efflux system outer membrane protein
MLVVYADCPALSLGGRRLLGLSLLLCFLQGAVAQAPPGGSTSPAISLEQATRMALEHNRALRAQRLNVDQAKAGQITAGLKPNPVYAMVNEDFPVFSPKDMTFANLRDNQEFLQSMSFTYERGGKRAKRIRVAEDNTDVTTHSVADAERQLRFQVAQSFIAMLLAKSNLEFAGEDLKNFNEVVELNRRRMESGDISESDFLKISLQKLQFEQDVSAAQLALAQTRAALRQLLGYESVPESFDVAGDLAHRKYLVTIDELQNRALVERPDLLAAQSGVRLANDTVALAYGNRARDLTWEVEYKRAGMVNGVGFGASIEIPFHDRNQGEIARSRVAVRQAQESEAFTRTGALTDVLNAYSGWRSADEVVGLYEAGYLDQATKSRDISDYAYRRGAASLLDLLDAERSYRATQLAYRQALADYMISVEQVNMAVGAQVMQ